MKSKFKLHPIRLTCLSIILLVLHQFVSAQSFWNEHALGKSFFSGIAIAAADVNGDATDDLLILDQSKKLWYGINDGSAHFFWTELPFHSLTAVYSINVADVDRNGYNDIALSGEGTQVHILYQSSTGFSDKISDVDYFFSQAACFFDINRDGWIDFTICDDNAASRVYLNDSTGQLIRNNSLIDLELPGVGNSAGNYGIIWTDFDWNGIPDLYISKCKPGVNDPRDPRRLNLFYVYDSLTKSWINQAVIRGLDIGDQSWASLFEDFDNDGLTDVFVINHYTPCNLLKQTADHRFENVTASAGLEYNGIALQAVAFDYDNDGDLDILLTGTGTELWQNLGGFKFEKLDIEAFSQAFSSCATGDFNNDGRMDVYASYADLLNAPSNKQDKLWLNPSNGNNYIKFNFEGTRSNRNGIGAKIKLFVNGTIQIREVHAGESYGIQNSLAVYFGLAKAQRVDSVYIYWPSGLQEVFYDLTPNTHYNLYEGGCYQIIDRTNPNKLFFCGTIDTSLIADNSFRDIHWNTGSNSYKIQLVKEGVYFYTARDSNNCFFISDPVSVYLNPKNQIQLNHRFTKYLCSGDELELALSPKESVRWSTTDSAASITIKTSGLYYAIRQGICDLEYSDTLNVQVFDPPNPPQIKPDTAYKSGPRILNGGADSCFWYRNKDDLFPIASGPFFTTDSLLQSTSYWLEFFNRNSYPNIHGGLKTPSYSSGPYHAAFINNQMLFTVFNPVILDSITVYTDDPGKRIIELLDAKGVVIQQQEINPVKGRNQVFLGFNIPPAAKPYKLTTNSIQNTAVFGSISPRLYRSDQNFYYPFFIEDKIRINTSDKGDSYYYYFYDWVVRSNDLVCKSERVEFPVVLIPDANQDVMAKNLKLYINSNHELIIEGIDGFYQIEILKMDGSLLGQFISSTASDPIHTEMFPPGLYFIRINAADLDQSAIRKIFITGN
ncbi:MAG: CRTAC1 family protein [Saprospiraceae bacterium]